mmetsp:Transcript_36256/g.47817  ORF Transcript_36256/g.47817 Transcript_36256/m.47817 type:complete len:477 (-) Transcript_36256:304-1734(-)
MARSKDTVVVDEEVSLSVLQTIWPAIAACCAVLLFASLVNRFGKSALSVSMVPIMAAAIWFLQYTDGLSTLTNAFLQLDPVSLAVYAALALSAHLIIGIELNNLFTKKKESPLLLRQSSERYLSYPKLPEDDDKTAFMMVYDMLKHELIAELPVVFEQPDEAVDWIEKMIDYNVTGGKMNRGLVVIGVMRALAEKKGKKLTNKELSRACVLGWCIEWLQAFFLVADDIMDDSKTRRGQPCWFRKSEVKMIAINDSFILESAVFRILKRHFGHDDYYVQIVDIFHEVIYQTELGQLLDLTSQPLDGPANFDRFTIERHSLIVKYKTAFYTFYLSTALGMITSGVTEPGLYETAKRICCIIGEYFQIQDDVLDCYGDPETIGKIGTDIQDNKCSWLVVQALDMANDKERKLLEENYGKDDNGRVQKVKELYKKFGLKEKFDAYEEQSYKDINELLDSVEGLPREIFDLLLGKIYKRSK